VSYVLHETVKLKWKKVKCYVCKIPKCRDRCSIMVNVQLAISRYETHKINVN